MKTVVWLLWIWVHANPEMTIEYRFQSAEACQDYRAVYVSTHPSDPARWEISRCKAREVENSNGVK